MANKPSSNVAAAYRFLRRKGLSPAQASGVIGSMQGESGLSLDPAAVNPNGGATGIAQWLGGRKTAAVMTKQLGPQLNHLWGELQGPERGAYKALKAAHTPEQAAIAWQRAFERGAPFEQKYNLRASNARKVFNQLAGADVGSLPTAGGSSGGKTRSVPGATVTSATWNGGVQPARDEPSMKAAIMQTLGQRRGLGDFRRSRLKQAQYLFQSGAATERVPVQATGNLQLTRTQVPGAPQRPSNGGGSGAAASLGNIEIFNKNPERLNHMVTDFAKRLAGQANTTLKLDSGATHSKFTVNGNVSEHWTGHATDIPANGERLTRLGQEALITAGWSPKRARATKGGLFNVVHNGVRYQIIFNTMEGGNHFTHLHVGAKKL